MSTFDLLSANIQKKVWDMNWNSFTPVQDMAIPSIIKTNKDVILSSGTASGKTEAAFLPILSLIEQEAEEKLKVIYISPLKPEFPQFITRAAGYPGLHKFLSVF